MSLSNILLGSVLILTTLYVYKSSLKKNVICEDSIESRQQCEFEKLKTHLLENSSLSRCNKPIIWIHLDFQQNARQYINFASKNSKELNMPYILLCIKTIVDNCSDSFHVVIMDNSSFQHLIPGWNIEVSNLSDPLRTKYIDLAKLNVLKNFGGVFVPPSFVCKKDIYDLYYKNCIYNKNIMTFEFPSNYSGINSKFVPKIDFIGSQKNNNKLNSIIQEYEYSLSKDYTDESEFKGTMSRILMDHCDNVSVLDGKLICTKDTKSKVIIIDDLMEMKKLNLCSNHYGLYIPANDLKRRNKFNWMLYISPMEVLESKTFIGKYLSQSI